VNDEYLKVYHGKIDGKNLQFKIQIAKCNQGDDALSKNQLEIHSSRNI
jgi:hypothetical protein